MFRRFNLRLLLETLGGFLLALVLLALFFESFATAGVRNSGTRALALVPANAEMIVSLDMFTLRKSDLVAEMEKRFDSIPEAAENYRRFVQESGIDPRQDTDQILMSLRQVEGGADSGILIVAQGRFGSSRLLSVAAEKGGSVVKLADGSEILTLEEGATEKGEGATPHKSVALAQPSEEMLVFGEKSEVVRAMGVLSGETAPETKDGKLRSLLSQVDRRAPVWVILNSSALAGKLSTVLASAQDSKPGTALVSKIESMTLMGWVGKDVDLRARISAQDSETAGLLADLARGALAAGKLAAKDQDPELLKALQDARLSQDGSAVELEARIPASRFQAPSAQMSTP